MRGSYAFVAWCFCTVQSALYYECEDKVSPFLLGAPRQHTQYVIMQSAGSPILSTYMHLPGLTQLNKNHASPCPDDGPQVDDEGFRAKYLSPPPNVSPLGSSTRVNVTPKGLQPA